MAAVAPLGETETDNILRPVFSTSGLVFVERRWVCQAFGQIFGVLPRFWDDWPPRSTHTHRPTHRVPAPLTSFGSGDPSKKPDLSRQSSQPPLTSNSLSSSN